MMALTHHSARERLSAASLLPEAPPRQEGLATWPCESCIVSPRACLPSVLQPYAERATALPPRLTLVLYQVRREERCNAQSLSAPWPCSW